MAEPTGDIRALFFTECDELLEALQDGLQAMQEGRADGETINVVFRAVHSIKGGAAAFGLAPLVEFAHEFETALDALRAGRLRPDADLVELFFSVADRLGDLVADSREGRAPDPSQTAGLSEALRVVTGAADAPAAAEPVDSQPTPIVLDLDLSGAGSGSADGDDGPPEVQYRIRFRPDAALYASGNEPLYLLRALRDLGPLSVTCDDSDLPPLDALEPEASHLGWDIVLATGEGEHAIREVFEFAEGLCALDITPLSGPVTSAPADPRAAMPPEPAPPQERAVPPKQTPPAAQANARPRSTVRVDLERIDRLVNLVGEIVISQAMLSQSAEAAGLPPNAPLRTGLEAFLQLTRDIQESVMTIRAQPVKTLFQRMGRIVREAAAETGKPVQLHTEGEQTEIDKSVIERLADPLTHMIRNAVDHGLESPEDRLAAGKPREGRVFLSAEHRSGRVMIELRDDGAGIDRVTVFRKAVERGLVDVEAQLSAGEIDNLLFLPGFSTCDGVSTLSGRGVGMDVVRSAIQGLGGRVSIRSEHGRGTTISISLPLTLAVLDGMVIRVAGETLVVPLSTIRETMAVTAADLRTLGPSTHVVLIRERAVAMLDLGAELGYRAPLDELAGHIALVVGNDDASATALVVDSIDDHRQVVIKGLKIGSTPAPGIAAATILGDGQIALILDPLELVTHAHGRAPAALHAAPQAAATPARGELA